MLPENSSQTALVLLGKKADENLWIKHSAMLKLLKQIMQTSAVHNFCWGFP